MDGLIHQFNRLSGQNRSLIRKALDSTTGVGEALTPQFLEQIITNTIVQLSPEIAMIQAEFGNQKLHEFNRITALPAAGGAMGEGATTPTRQSAFQRANVTLKVIRRKGSVTNFLQDSSASYIDAAAAEMENHLLAHVYDLIFYSYYGNKDANTYEYDGWDKMISSNRFNATTAVPTSLDFLDQMLDANSRNQGAKHEKAFCMSPEMLSKVSQLLTNVRNLQNVGGAGLREIEIPGGWRLMSYRNVPIIETTSTRPIAKMTTVTATPATSGGSLADDTYYFRVAPITYKGEQEASDEVNATVSGGGGSGKVTLSFTAFNTSPNAALSYRVYAGTTTGVANTTLKKVSSAFTFDANGTITGDVTSIEITTLTTGSDVTSAMANDKPLVSTASVPEEVVYLIDFDKYQGIGKMPYTNTAGDRFNGLVTMKPLAETDDFIPFLIKTYAAIADAFEGTSAVIRGLRTS